MAMNEKMLHRLSQVVEIQWHRHEEGFVNLPPGYDRAGRRLLALQKELQDQAKQILVEEGIPSEDWSFTVDVMSTQTE